MNPPCITPKPAPVIDLSKIDFEALRSRFKESKQKNTDLEVLKPTIRAMLERLISLNKTRADFASTFEELIDPTTPATGTSRSW